MFGLSAIDLVCGPHGASASFHPLVLVTWRLRPLTFVRRASHYSTCRSAALPTLPSRRHCRCPGDVLEDLVHQFPRQCRTFSVAICSNLLGDAIPLCAIFGQWLSIPAPLSIHPEILLTSCGHIIPSSSFLKSLFSPTNTTGSRCSCRRKCLYTSGRHRVLMLSKLLRSLMSKQRMTRSGSSRV